MNIDLSEGVARSYVDHRAMTPLLHLRREDDKS